MRVRKPVVPRMMAKVLDRDVSKTSIPRPLQPRELETPLHDPLLTVVLKGVRCARRSISGEQIKLSNELLRLRLREPDIEGKPDAVVARRGRQQRGTQDQTAEGDDHHAQVEVPHDLPPPK